LRKLSFWSAGVLIVGSFVIVACVGDDPAVTPAGTGAQGSLDNPCFANGTCNNGLTCSVIQGASKCVAPGDAATADATAADDASPVQVTDSGPTGCLFTPTSFPCTKQQPFACYGSTQGCTATGCSPDLAWTCFSRRQCNDIAPCCLSNANAALTTTAGCTQGTLQMSPTATSGASCSTTLACGAGDTRLCQADIHCLDGQRCVPIKVTGGGAALDGKVFIGACAP
jgi:hypothetical protein